MGGPRAGRPGRRHRRLPPVADLRPPVGRDARPAATAGSPGRRRRALREWFIGEAPRRGLDVDDRPGRQPLGLVRRTPTRAARAWCSAATSTRCPTAARSTARSASSPPSPRWTRCCDRVDARPPLGIACFADEEGARFGVACAGSRLLTGALDADRARALTDDDGTTMAEAMARAGSTRPRSAGTTRRCAGSARSSNCTSSRAARWSTATRRSASASAIWPHGRWRLTSPAGPTTPAPPGWPTATTRCSRSPTPSWRPAPRPSGTARWPPSARSGCGRTGSTRSRRRSPPGSTPAGPTRTTSARWSPTVGAAAGGHARSRSRGRRPPPFDAGAARPAGRAARRRPGAADRRRATTPASWPRPASRPRCCSSATPPGSRHSPAEHAERDDCLAGVAALTRG